MTYMEMHSAVLNEVIHGDNGKNLKTLITTDFTNVCNVDIGKVLPGVLGDDVVVVNDTIKNIIVYESIKQSTLTNTLETIFDIIDSELYILINSNRISTATLSDMLLEELRIVIVDTFNKTKNIMSKYNLIPNPYIEITPIYNTYNHKLGRHFITIGVYDCD